MLPKNPRERMPVYTQDSTHLECSVFTHICSISHYIPTTIVVRISNICNLTGKYLPASSTIFNINGLSELNSSVYHFFNGHDYTTLNCSLVSGGGNGMLPFSPFIAEPLISPPSVKGRSPSELSSGFSNRVNSPLKSNKTMSVAPLRCFAMMISALLR